MLAEIEITTGGNPFQLLGAERELVENIDRRLGIVCQLLRAFGNRAQGESRLKPMLSYHFKRSSTQC